MTCCTNRFTASFFSSNRCAIMSESLSKPSANCVRSLEPMLKPSKTSANLSARTTLDGISHITYTSSLSSSLSFSLSSALPRFKPNSAIVAITFLPSSGVLQNGTITLTFVSPISSRTFFIALHSNPNAGLNFLS